MIKKVETFIGIDPGANGGIAIFGKGKIQAVKMPKDLYKLQDFLKYAVDTYDNTCVFIEHVQAWVGDDAEPGKKFGINKLLKNLNQITGTLTLMGIPYCPVYPVSWQSTLGLRIKDLKETDTEKKNRFKDYAQNCFPEIQITLATSDAVCLVQFGLMKYENDPDWIWDHIKNNRPAQLL